MKMIMNQKKHDRAIHIAKIKAEKSKIMTDPILHKGHAHGVHNAEPEVCPACKGNRYTKEGYECFMCDGEGEI